MIEQKQFGDYKWAEYRDDSWFKRYISGLHKEVMYAIVIAVIFGVVLLFIKLFQFIFEMIGDV